MANATFEKDLTHGSVVKNLIVFALPFLLSNLIQSLYNVADMIIVGNFAGTLCLDGVNIGAQISFVLMNMAMGLCVGGTVLIAQYLSAGRKKEMEKTIATLMTTLLLAAVVITALCLILRRPLISIFSDDPEVYGYTSDYFLVTSLGTVFIFLYNALAAIMRGLGDSRRPLVFVSIACVVNVGLDLLLVSVFNMAALGAAIATVISQALSAVLCMIHLSRHGFMFDFKPKSFKIDKQQFKMLLRIGLPSSVQNMATGMSFLFITALANGLSPVVGSAVGVVGKLNGFAIMPAVAMSSSISAVSAQNIGAGQLGRAKKTMLIGMAISFAISCGVFALFQTCPDVFLKLFVSATDPHAADMVQYGTDYVSLFSYDYLIVPFMFAMNGLFIGSGHTLFSLINNVISAIVLRIPFSYFGEMLLENHVQGIGLGAPAASLFSVVLCIIFYCTGKWKKMMIIKDIDVCEEID